jgi:drug/metabolite transporter (DMT)-like permease
MRRHSGIGRYPGQLGFGPPRRRGRRVIGGDEAIDEHPTGPSESPAMTERAAHLKGIVLIVLTMLCFVAMDTVVKALVRDYPVTEVVWARYVFHVLVTIAVLAPRRRLSLRTNRLALQLFRSLLLVIATVSFFTALTYVPLADASVITHAAPLLVTALSVPLLRETVGPWRWSAVVVGFIGVLIVMRPGLGVMHPAAFLVLGTAFCFALYQVATRRLATTEDPFTTLLYTGITGAVLASLVVPFTWQTPTALGWTLMLVTGAFGGLGHYLLIKAHNLTPVSVLAPFIYTQLVWATLSGWIFFGDFPDKWTIIGAGVIAASGLYILYRENRYRAS